MGKEQEAIETIEHLLIKHLHTHIDWLGYLTKNPKEQTKYISIKDQKEAIADYDEALKALAILKEQPPAGEFTEKIRHNLKVQGRAGDIHRLGNTYAELLKEACTRLDQSEAENKKLIEGQQAKITAGS